MNRNLILTGMLALCAASQAGALTMPYTNRSGWQAQVSNLFVFDSGAQVVGTSTTFNTAGGLALPELQINGYDNLVNDLSRVHGNATTSSFYNWDSGAILRSAVKSGSNAVYIRINFLTPVSAFGFDYGAGGSGGTPANISVIPEALPSVLLASALQPTLSFYGIVSDSQTFQYVDIFMNDNGRYLVLDNISEAAYTPGSETMEPGTWLQILLGGGLLTLATRRRMVRNQAV